MMCVCVIVCVDVEKHVVMNVCFNLSQLTSCQKLGDKRVEQCRTGVQVPNDEACRLTPERKSLEWCT